MGGSKSSLKIYLPKRVLVKRRDKDPTQGFLETGMDFLGRIDREPNPTDKALDRFALDLHLGAMFDSAFEEFLQGFVVPIIPMSPLTRLYSRAVST